MLIKCNGSFGIFDKTNNSASLCWKTVPLLLSMIQGTANTLCGELKYHYTAIKEKGSASFTFNIAKFSSKNKKEKETILEHE